MKEGKRTCLVVALITVTMLSKERCAFANGDTQFWQTTIASFDLNPGWSIAIEEHLKIAHDAGDLYYHHTDLGFVYKSLAKWMDLSFNYKQVFKKDDDRHWEWENRPHLNVMLREQLGTFDIFNRLRLEYRDRENSRDIWRYTHLLKVTLPFELTKYKLRPYVADQIFVNLEGKAFDKNRIYSGLSCDLFKKVKVQFCYIYQSSKPDGQWEDLNALGLLFGIRF